MDTETKDLWQHFYDVADVAAIAAEIHAGPERESDGIFSTESFQSAVAQTHYAYRVSEAEATIILQSDRRIIRLAGGWMLLGERAV